MNHFPKILMLTCILILLLLKNGTGAAHPSQGWGRVNMQGAIIDTACAIAAGSREQVIEMDIAPIADIIRDGRGAARQFSIELINCALPRNENKLPDWNGFQVAFDGDTDGEFFGITGEAQGIGLLIIDDGGNIARPGNPLPIGKVTSGNMRLNYEIRLVSNNKPLRLGEYYSAVRFKMDYY